MHGTNRVHTDAGGECPRSVPAPTRRVPHKGTDVWGRGESALGSRPIPANTAAHDSRGLAVRQPRGVRHHRRQSQAPGGFSGLAVGRSSRGLIIADYPSGRHAFPGGRPPTTIFSNNTGAIAGAEIATAGEASMTYASPICRGRSIACVMEGSKAAPTFSAIQGVLSAFTPAWFLPARDVHSPLRKEGVR